MKYLLYTDNKIGGFVTMRPADTSDDYGKLQRKFAARYNPGQDYAEMFTVYPDEQAAGLYYVYDLCRNGAMFTLLVLPDTPRETVKAAKRELRHTHDVVSIYELRIKKLVEVTK